MILPMDIGSDSIPPFLLSDHLQLKHQMQKGDDFARQHPPITINPVSFTHVTVK